MNVGRVPVNGRGRPDGRLERSEIQIIAAGDEQVPHEDGVTRGRVLAEAKKSR